MELMSVRIEQKRKEHGWTMKELADKVGVTASTVNKWEKGQIHNLKRDTIDKLAKVLQVNPVWLMGIDDNTQADYSIKLTGEEQELLFEYRKLTNKHKEMLGEFIEVMKNAKERENDN